MAKSHIEIKQEFEDGQNIFRRPSMQAVLEELESESNWATHYHRRAETLQTHLSAAQNVIAEFVYPQAPMTPAQRAAWEAWEKLEKEKETK